MKNRAVIAAGLFTVWLGWVSVAAGQTSPPKSWRAACAAEQVETRATRPNFSSATDTTLCGVVEADYGWARQWPGADVTTVANPRALDDETILERVLLIASRGLVEEQFAIDLAAVVSIDHLAVNAFAAAVLAVAGPSHEAIAAAVDA